MTLTCIVVMALQACNHAPLMNEAPSAGTGSAENHAQDGDNVVLAGEWEYEEDGVVVPLRLDRFGNGTYDYKDGRFLTDLLSDHRWAGVWVQRENDREGRFEIRLSADYSEGEGRWWYTRIQRDTTPMRPGGRFHLMKVRSTAVNQSLSVNQSQ
jgi:hypothetical protein